MCALKYSACVSLKYRSAVSISFFLQSGALCSDIFNLLFVRDKYDPGPSTLGISYAQAMLEEIQICIFVFPVDLQWRNFQRAVPSRKLEL